MRETRLKEDKAITLIALVVTIIVLLLLSGIAIQSTFGQNGILTVAKEAKIKTEDSSEKEVMVVAIIASLSKDTDEIKNLDTLKNEFERNGLNKENLIEEQTGIYEYEGENNNYIINKNGEILNCYKDGDSYFVSTTTSRTKWFADIEGDGIVDGIIYADLLADTEKSGVWNNLSSELDFYGKYSYPEISSPKAYYISQESYTDEYLGTNPVITPLSGTGEDDRFYVMALNDFAEDGTNTAEKETKTWYWNKDSKTKNLVLTSEDIMTDIKLGTGKTNTDIIKRSELANYTSNPWSKIPDDWFIPSRAEFAAFGKNLEVISNYEGSIENEVSAKNSKYPNYYANLGLSSIYWTSSQMSSYVCNIFFSFGCFDYQEGENPSYVRLSTTF